MGKFDLQPKKCASIIFSIILALFDLFAMVFKEHNFFKKAHNRKYPSSLSVMLASAPIKTMRTFFKCHVIIISIIILIIIVIVIIIIISISSISSSSSSSSSSRVYRSEGECVQVKVSAYK